MFWIITGGGGHLKKEKRKVKLLNVISSKDEHSGSRQFALFQHWECVVIHYLLQITLFS